MRAWMKVRNRRMSRMKVRERILSGTEVRD